MIKAGIIGGAGYTAGELIRILLYHPHVTLQFVQSESQANKPLTHIHKDLLGETAMTFSENIDPTADVIFFCSGHGRSKEILAQYTIDKNCRIIDLSNDFRLKADAKYLSWDFVYGLPELNKNKISQAGAVANPGCFATAIQLALLPLFAHHQVKEDVHIHAITGSTGAGQSLMSTTHFTWRNSNVSVYKAFTHQHLGEIGESVHSLDPDYNHALNFIPIRGNFTRGILATAYTTISASINDLLAQYQDYYAEAPFTVCSDEPISLKQVVNTNKCLLHLQKNEDKLLITSCIDNLLKGASGQAVQNMNLMFDLPENTGLQLKPSAF